MFIVSVISKVIYKYGTNKDYDRGYLVQRDGYRSYCGLRYGSVIEDNRGYTAITANISK